MLIRIFWKRLDNNKLRNAVHLWTYNKSIALSRFGHISTWNTSRVTDMSYLFWRNAGFNDDISSWDTSNVTNMIEMFSDASDSIKIFQIGLY